MINFGFSLERTFATSYIVDRFMNLSDNCTVLDVISAENGAKFTSIVMVKAVETKLAKNNAEYLSVTVGDKSSTCICKIFGSSPTYNFFKSAPAGSIILLEGIRKDYNGAMSPEITSVRMMTDREIAEGNLRNMVTLSAVEGVDILKKDLMSITATISDDNLRATVMSIFNEFGDEFLNKAAGISMHHAYKNGLLEHTVHSARCGMALLKLYPFISYDLAIAGLLLHDIGKVLEYTDEPNVQKTKIGILQGHLALGYRIVRKFALQNKVRDDMIEICKTAAKKMKYTNAGTFEFMFEDGKFYFLEMNTRLQVEHPVTEMVYGVDLVREQIRIAAGERLGYNQSNIVPHGHAIEFRINAEDPETFIPNPGTITLYAPSGGLGVRVDSAVYTGYTIPPTYDSMIAKLIVHAQSRPACIMRAERALDEFVIEGVKTTIPLQKKLLENSDVRQLKIDNHWLESFLEKKKQEQNQE